jgi:predicted ATPase
LRDLRGFREAVRAHRRAVGRTQQQLARSIGLHPDVLSHKLNGRDNAVLTTPDVIGIATTLAGWGALASRADLHALLDLMEVPRHAVPAAAWAAPPLVTLRAGGEGAAPRAAAEPPARLRPAPLPAPATRLIGREHERAAVAAALATSRLVTLTGVGGTGKTRLALQVAHDLAGTFADGVAFIDLAAVRDPALLATTVARGLGLAPRSAEAAGDHLAEALAGHELLIVLDNLEQLIDETHLLARMLATAPAVRLLATSRIPLRLYGEHMVRVPPLHPPSAVRLFLARARAVRPDFAPDDGQLAAVGAICTALDGLPLAIELAAARVRLYSPAALLPLLRSRLDLLTGGPRNLPHRQQTLRAALDWSHELLPPGARHLFARLGVFAGPFDAAAAAAVEGQPAAVSGTLESLAELADQSLLEVTAGENPGFRMLQTVREYSLARLAETGERDDVRRRHLAHFMAVAMAVRDGLDGPEQAALLDRLEAAYPNLLAALEFACHQAERDGTGLDDGLRLAASLSVLWQRRGSLAEGVLQLDRLLALDGAQRRASAPEIRAAAVLAACNLACFKGDYVRAVELARQGIELFGSLGDHRGMARAYRFLGETAIAVGDDDAAEPQFEAALAEAIAAGDRPGEAHACNMLGQVARHRGDFRRASTLFWRALKLFRGAGDPNGVATVLGSLGETARDAGQARRAQRLYLAALRRDASLGNKRLLAYDLEGLAAALGLQRAGRQALVYLGAAQALRDETGGPLPPVEQAILTRIIAAAVAPLSAEEQQQALGEGRGQPLPVTLALALGQPEPRPRRGNEPQGANS